MKTSTNHEFYIYHISTMKPQHIILIGFKNAGKSTIGKELAEKIQRTFIDLDEEITKEHQKRSQKNLTCREIMKLHGEKFFRELEHEVLANIMTVKKPMILAVGGGTPMMKNNRNLLQKQMIVHITAPKSIIFERIVTNGKPAFFPKEQDSFVTFQELWNEREPIFNKIANITVKNSGSVEEAVEKLLEQMRRIHL